MAAPVRAPITTIGSERAGTDGSALGLYDSAGTLYVLWVQSGKLYIGTAAQFDAQSGGTVVGSQS